MEKVRVVTKIDLVNSTIEVKIYAPEKLITEFVEELREAEKRGEICIEKLEVTP